MPYRSPVVCGLHYGWYCFRDSQRISHKSCSLISEEELYSYLLEFNGLSCTSQAVGSDAVAWGFLSPVQVFVAMDVFTSVLQDILIPCHPLFCLCWRLPWILWSSGPSSHSPSFILDILVSLVPGNLQPRCMCWLPEHRDSPPSLANSSSHEQRLGSDSATLEHTMLTVPRHSPGSHILCHVFSWKIDKLRRRISAKVHSLNKSRQKSFTVAKPFLQCEIVD